MSEGDTTGKVITCKAAVCYKVREPFVVETIQVAPPKAGEVRFKVMSAGVCHSDVSMWQGKFSDPIGPMVFGHEGAGQVESVGPGVTTLKPGDYVIPIFCAQCGKCDFCAIETSNMCQKGHPLGNCTMDDGTTRFSKDGKTYYHQADVSSFSQYSVAPERACVKINPNADMDKVCLFGCCIPTGYGAAKNVAKVTPGSTCAVWGLGAVGLSTVMGCKNSGASRIIAVDINPSKIDIAKKLGATDFVNPLDHKKPIQEVLKDMTGGHGLDFTFECIGNSDCAFAALDSCKKGSGVSVMVGLGNPNQPIPGAALVSLIQNRKWLGTFYGGYRGKKDIPALVDECVDGKINLGDFVTHTLPLEKINEAFDLLIAGKSIRTIILPNGPHKK